MVTSEQILKANRVKYGAMNRRVQKAEVLFIKDRSPPADNLWHTWGRFPRQNASWSPEEDAHLKALAFRFVSHFGYDADVDADWSKLTSDQAMALIALRHGRNCTSIIARMRAVLGLREQCSFHLNSPA